MSRYLHIYLRSKDSGAFTHIYMGTFWHRVSDAFGYVPYEKVRRVSEAEFEDNIHTLDKMIEACKDKIAADEDFIKEIGTWNNSIEAKIEEIENMRDSIDNTRDEMDELETVRDFLWMLTCLDISGGLYVGLECGGSITDADIEQKT